MADRFLPIGFSFPRILWFFLPPPPFLAGPGIRFFEEKHVTTVSGEERFRLKAVAAEGVNPL